MEPTPGPANEDRFAPERAKWVIPVVVTALVVGLGGVAAYWLTRPNPTTPAASEKEPRKAESPAQTEPPPKSGEFIPPAEVNVEITSSPQSAAIWVGDEDSSRGTTPARLTLPRATSPVDIVLRAPGYLDKRLAMDVSHDRTVNIHLDPREGPHPQVKTSGEDTDKLGKSGPKKEKVKEKERKSSGKRGGGTETVGEFKPVGD